MGSEEDVTPGTRKELYRPRLRMIAVLWSTALGNESQRFYCQYVWAATLFAPEVKRCVCVQVAKLTQLVPSVRDPPPSTRSMAVLHWMESFGDHTEGTS